MAEIKDRENALIMETTKGKVVIELFPDLAPGHVGRIKELAREGAYDGVVFHRVIDGFMAQTGDVKFGNSSKPSFAPARAGTRTVSPVRDKVMRWISVSPIRRRSRLLRRKLVSASRKVATPPPKVGGCMVPASASRINVSWSSSRLP